MQFNFIKMKALKDTQEGYIILEGLISAAIVGIFMTAVIFMMSSALRANTEAGKISEALSLGADVIERISLLPMNDPDLQNNTFAEPPMEKDGFPAYWFTINTIPNNTYNDTIDIEVIVRWRHPDGVLVGAERFKSVTLFDTITNT